MPYRLTVKQRRALDRLANSRLSRALGLPVEGRALKGRAIAARLRVESLRWAIGFAVGPVMVFSILFLVALIEGQAGDYLAPVGGAWFAVGVSTLAALFGWLMGRRVLGRFYLDVEMQQADAPDFYVAGEQGLTVTGANRFRLAGNWDRWSVLRLAIYPAEGQGRSVGKPVFFRSITLALDGDEGRAVTLDPLLIERGAALCAVAVRALERAGAFTPPG